MRDIKFRFWLNNAKVMHSMEDFILGCNLGGYDFAETITGKCVDVSVMQYTGLKDKNGVEIYEDDVIKDHIGTGFVEYLDEKASFRVNYMDSSCKWFIDYSLRGERESIEVIGNIYQHKNLIDNT